jgi:Family of unknown function (DUF6600)
MSSRSIFQRPGIVWFALLLLSAANVSIALADDTDPPDRAARLSFTRGAVSVQPAGVQDWTDATVNRPLTIGDKLWADQDSRAEVDIGSAAIRLGSMTGLSVLNLDDQTTQMNVTAGTAIVHVFDVGDNQSIEIDTPNVAVTVQSPGDYRVEVNDSGDTVVKVSDGDAQVSAGAQAVPMHTQEAYTFTGTDQVSVDPGSVGSPDVLDQWSLDRDHHEEQAQVESNQYVAPDVEGAQDLADYGTWQDTPDYGYVWTPTAVAADWSPYRFGRWVWVAPWGWTWVDDAPWGFAPFHYGRWTYLGSRWSWVPGPRRVRPVYAPALVAWVGSPVAGVSFSAGAAAGVGWFPLGPREVFVPGYNVSNNYLRNVNVSNTTIVNTTYITNVYENRATSFTYVNRNRPGAVVAVSQSVFTSAQPVRGNTLRMAEGELARMGAHGVAPAIAPVRESVLGRPANMNARRPPAALFNRPVVARIAPPPAPVAFDREQQAIRSNGNRPLARSQILEMQPRSGNPQVRVISSGPVRPAQMQNNANRFLAGRPLPGGETQTLQDRERALHTSPVLPAVPPSPFRNDRPSQTSTRPIPQAYPIEPQRQDTEAERQAEAQRQVQMQRQAEAQRQVEVQRQAQVQRQAEAQRQAEVQRQAEAQRQAEVERQAEVQRQAEAQRQAEMQRQAEAQRQFAQRSAEQSPGGQTRPEAHPIESPHPAPQGHPGSAPQRPQDDHRGKPGPERP